MPLLIALPGRTGVAGALETTGGNGDRGWPTIAVIIKHDCNEGNEQKALQSYAHLASPGGQPTDP